MGKAEDTKARLERAALTLFVARGVAETTTKEIAMAASVAEGTIYRYFPSKEQLALDLFLHHHRALAEALGRGGHPDYYRLYKQGGAMDEAVAAARRFLQDNGVRVDEASVQSLTADIFNETGLAGSREAFAEAFTALAREG